ncbi:hypothetical protein V7124_07740 [Neobacillus niacini]|uniref:alginate O-acetyltransferase AlgX-related protein n=1 Tax=Neobacillus niacini TaxID=86668 RepID=UPI002FFEB3CB
MNNNFRLSKQSKKQIDDEKKVKKTLSILNILFILLFALILLIPNLKLNLQKNAVSEIDNRMLTEFPKRDESFLPNLSNFYSDRLGYRNEIINTYSKFNNIIFNEMVHPTYMYGQDGYVFTKLGRAAKDYDFMKSFAKFLRELQDYCEERNVPFIYMLIPSKTTVYEDKLPSGFAYDNSRIELLIQELNRLEVNYLYTADPLIERRKTEEVFNVQYDAGHWNEYGAHYSTSLLFDRIKEYYPDIKFAKRDDYEITQKLETSLPVSNFEINEYVPLFTHKDSDYVNDQKYAEEIQLDLQNRHYRHFVNKSLQSNAPKLLFFHGSYYREDRDKFVVNSFAETMSIHNYINVTNFDYYFNIANPEIVILTSAEYATTDSRFPVTQMAAANLQPAYSNYENLKSIQASDKAIEYHPDEDKQLQNVTVKLNMPEKPKAGYLLMKDRIYDMKILVDKGSISAQVTVPTENLTHEAEIVFIPENEENKIIQKLIVK